MCQPSPDIQSFQSPFSTEIIEDLKSVLSSIFGSVNPEKLQWKFEHMDGYLLMAYRENKPVGCKLGYRRNHNTFHSWLGGVLESHRRQGIGKQLMKRQHKWCRNQGFDVITTATKNEWTPMTIFNLQNGFRISGTRTTDSGEVKILMAKTL